MSDSRRALTAGARIVEQRPGLKGLLRQIVIQRSGFSAPNVITKSFFNQKKGVVMTKKELFDQLRVLPAVRRTIFLCGPPYSGKSSLRKKIRAFYGSVTSEGAPWYIIEACCSVTKQSRARLALTIPRTGEDILILVNPPLDTIMERYRTMEPLLVREREKIYKVFQETKPDLDEAKSLGFKHFFIVDK